MSYPRFITTCLAVIWLVFSAFACSTSESPVQPENDGDYNLPVLSESDSESRTFLSMYDVEIDPEAGTFSLTPFDRNPQFHFPLTNLYPGVLQITGYGFSPNFWADIKLAHPLPGSGIAAFDPRVIAILPANPGVSMNYPIFNVLANNSVILEPDGYTRQFDSIAPLIPGNTNPFVSYFKDEPNRVWSSTETTEETKRWQMDLSGFGGPIQFKLVVDVSTNYPAAPQPIIDNAQEPVQLEFSIGEGLTTAGGSATVTATFLDWQGAGEIKCKVESPDLFTGAVQLFYTEPGPNPNEYVFTGTITNTPGTFFGNHSVLLAVWDTNVGNHIFAETLACVDISFNPVDVTPPWLNFSPEEICVDGNYIYIASGANGLNIFTFSESHKPVWLNKVETSEPALDVYVDGDYAYVAAKQNGLEIIDINPPESAHIVNSVEVQTYATAVYVSDGYAYVGDYNSEVHVIDIDPPESAYIVTSVDTPSKIDQITVVDGYAYVSSFIYLNILDIDPPQDSHLVQCIDLPTTIFGLYVEGGYAYLANATYGLKVMDIDPPEEAYVVKTIETPWASDVYVSNGYAYVTDLESGLLIMDIDPLETANIVKTVSTPNKSEGVTVSNSYAFVRNANTGFLVIGIDPYENAHIINSAVTPGCASNLSLSENFAYIADGQSGLQIIDIETPEDAYIVKTVDTPGNSIGVKAKNGYAYVGDGSDDELYMVDISSPHYAYIVSSFPLGDPGYDIDVVNGYAYVAAFQAELMVIDVDPIEYPSLVIRADVNGSANGVIATNEFVYVSSTSSSPKSLTIFDICNPENPVTAKIVETEQMGQDVCLDDDFAYVANYWGGLYIVDISQPESAYIVKNVRIIPETAMGVDVEDGYAYLTCAEAGLYIIDVNPPESAHVLDSIDTPGNALKVEVSDGFAYIADKDGGLRIIDLW